MKAEYPTANKEYPTDQRELGCSYPSSNGAKRRGNSKEREFDLQDRFIDYAVRIIKLSEALPDTKAGKHVSAQVLRSGTSPAPNYGEAQSAESKAGFVHKLKVALKELRETETWLKIIAKAKMIKPTSQLTPLLQETDELIAILFKSVETARKSKAR